MFVDRTIKIIDSINDNVGKVCSWAVVFLTLIVVYEVVMRRFLSSPTVWVFEISKQVFGFYCMIVTGYTLLYNSHVEINIFSDKLTKQKRNILEVICYLLFFTPFCLTIIIMGWQYAWQSFLFREDSGSAFGIILYPIKFIIPLTGCLLLMQGVAKVVSDLKTGKE